MLLAADGLGNPAIAQKVGVSRPTVLLWRGRYEVDGAAALEDLDRPGWPPRVEQAQVAKNPRVTLHFTPTSGSWMNMVEIFFGIITRQAIRRGTFDSVRDLEGAIRAFIDGWNDRCEPFIWTKDADTILAKAKRK